MNKELRIKIENLEYNYPLEEQVEDFLKLEKIEEYSRNTHYIIPKELVNLIDDFIKYKQNNGSKTEKVFYVNYCSTDMFRRLITKRPLLFMGKGDLWKLQNGKSGCGMWETIGTNSEKDPLLMKDYLTYDEIELSSFVSISINTPFINTGSRRNLGIKDSNHQSDGIYIGQCGARFEENSKMEFKYMLITPEQNTKKNGYGNMSTNYSMKHFAKFYSVDYFPEYNEVLADKTGRFVKIDCYVGVYLDTLVYKRRLRYNAYVFLQEANSRAKSFGKKAYVYAVGLGLGAWCIDKDLQTKLSIEVYLKLLNEYKFEHIDQLYFGWFNVAGLDIVIPKSINGITIGQGYGNPGEKLNDNNLLLVCNWAWDPNSYIGNEYWIKQLGSSGDPAAACCSYIAFLGNHDLFEPKKIISY